MKYLIFYRDSEQHEPGALFATYVDSSIATDRGVMNCIASAFSRLLKEGPRLRNDRDGVRHAGVIAWCRDCDGSWTDAVPTNIPPPAFFASIENLTLVVERTMRESGLFGWAHDTTFQFDTALVQQFSTGQVNGAFRKLAQGMHDDQDRLSMHLFLDRISQQRADSERQDSARRSLASLSDGVVRKLVDELVAAGRLPPLAPVVDPLLKEAKTCYLHSSTFLDPSGACHLCDGVKSA